MLQIPDHKEKVDYWTHAKRSADVSLPKNKNQLPPLQGPPPSTSTSPDETPHVRLDQKSSISPPINTLCLQKGPRPCRKRCDVTGPSRSGLQAAVGLVGGLMTSFCIFMSHELQGGRW